MNMEERKMGTEQSCLNEYQKWLNASLINDDLRKELLEIKSDFSEIEDRFYKNLSFGTGGLRGVIGAGINRMNVYTVRKATQGLANYIRKNFGDKKWSVAIAYDSRHYSEIFALEAALVLAANQIKANLFDSLRSTPELSYAVRHLDCSAGIVITASHNPPEYNGYKIYGPDGGQIALETANAIFVEMDMLDIFHDVKIMEKEEALDSELLCYIAEEVDLSYLSEVINLSVRKELSGKDEIIRIVYSPLHGTGLIPVTKALFMLGYNNLVVVESQLAPDGDFPNVKSPNPEDPQAYTEGIRLAEETGADILLVTDPDCDRVGVACRNSEGTYQILTGNQIGVLLTNYILSSKATVCSKDAIIKTIVTSDLGNKIAESFGATVFSTLTGFKFIGEKISSFECEKTYNFLFGYEESHGYLAGTFVRDKDAVIASVLIVEMAAYYKTRAMTLYDAMEAIYKKYGYYSEELTSYTLQGAGGKDIIKRMADQFRNQEQLIEKFGKISIIEDYYKSERTLTETGQKDRMSLPKADVLKLYFKDESWFAVRPSGTEPKLKIYYSAVGETYMESMDRLKVLKERVSCFIDEGSKAREPVKEI